MSREITTTVYQFEELTAKAQEKVISALADINVDFEWWDGEYEDAATVGIEIKSFGLDRNRHCCTNITNPIETAELILKNHGKECQTFKTAAAFLQDVKPLTAKFNKAEEISEKYSNSYSPVSYRLSYYIDKLKEEIEELEEEFKKSISEDYSIMLQNQCDYLQSEEAIKETIIANEYWFTAEGKMV